MLCWRGTSSAISLLLLRGTLACFQTKYSSSTIVNSTMIIIAYKYIIINIIKQLATEVLQKKLSVSILVKFHLLISFHFILLYFVFFFSMSLFCRISIMSIIYLQMPLLHWSLSLALIHSLTSSFPKKISFFIIYVHWKWCLIYKFLSVSM
jgi:hypothetical protein